MYDEKLKKKTLLFIYPFLASLFHKNENTRKIITVIRQQFPGNMDREQRFLHAVPKRCIFSAAI
jgi:hypothetical protein